MSHTVTPQAQPLSDKTPSPGLCQTHRTLNAKDNEDIF